MYTDMNNVIVSLIDAIANIFTNANELHRAVGRTNQLTNRISY